MVQRTFDENLKHYAEVLVRIGANVTDGDLLYFRTSVNTDPNVQQLAHYVVEAAYRAGAKFVDVEWRDEIMDRIRLLHAAEDSLDYFPDWRVKYIDGFGEAAASRLMLRGMDPTLFADIDSKKVARVQRAGQAAVAHLVPKLIDENIWSGAAIPVQAWADKVFPDVPAEKRMEKLWDAVFAATRVYEDDPIAAWQAHRQTLIQRRTYMDTKQYTALHFKGDGTDLTVGLPENHRWAGGASKHKSGKLFTPNIPTDEIFTMPHRERVNGTVKASKPLSYAGSLIKDFSFNFEAGRVKGFEAESGADLLQDLLDTDEGAKHTGEIALVPNSAPISQTGILFFNTLFDENAACHIALGRAYAKTIEGGTEMDDDEFIEAGGNKSQLHVDFMIGSEEMDVDGIKADGSREAVMRKGEWAFEV